MPFGMGPFGWAYVYPYAYPWAWTPGYAPWTPYAPWGAMPKEQEMAMLEDEARALERDLEAIKKRLTELRGE
jgi:hypothetical protein